MAVSAAARIVSIGSSVVSPASPSAAITASIPCSIATKAFTSTSTVARGGA
ncbi:MAG: hypothetical protein HY775_02390 [Acidobacteria bacterium]|nr:hypothetical protein [Acidobacteriota bacterium]